MRLWIGNLAPDTTDEDLQAFLEKYTRLQPEKIDRITGDGQHPGAILHYPHHDHSTALEISNRLHGMFWNGRALTVEPLTVDPV